MCRRNYKKENLMELTACLILLIAVVFTIFFCFARKIYAESYTYNDTYRYEFETYEVMVDINEMVAELEENYPIKIIFESNDRFLQKTFVLSLAEALEWYGPDIINKVAAYDQDETLEFTLQSYVQNQAYINDEGQYGAKIDDPATRVFIHEIYHLIDAVVGFDQADVFSQEIYLNEYCATSAQEDKAVSYEYYYLMVNNQVEEPQNDILKQKITAAVQVVEMLQKR